VDLFRPFARSSRGGEDVFLPVAIFAEVPGISWGDALYKWVFAFLGNLVGAAVFVSTA